MQVDHPYLIFGAGGHAKVAASIVLAQNLPLKGFIDTHLSETLKTILDYPILGPEEYIKKYAYSDLHLALGIGNNYKRAEILKRYPDYSFPFLIHPTALIEKTATLGAGTLVAIGSIIGVDVKIGRGVIINSGAIIDHECQIGDFAHISPGAKLAGNVIVGDYAHVGIGATVKEGVRIGKGSIVGAGSVVITDVAEGLVVAGIPAQYIKTVENL